MEKFIRLIALDGSVLAINLENCVLWGLSIQQGKEKIEIYSNVAGGIFTFCQENYSDLAWGKLRSDLERRTNRPWEKDCPEEKVTDFPSLG